MTAGRKLRGKSGLHEARVPGNARRGQPQGKRHREESALMTQRRFAFGAGKAMVKRWGKSPPRTWQQGRHGKPHPEQCRIGASRGKVRTTGASLPETSAGTLQPEMARVGSLTGAVTRLAEEWSSRGATLGQNPAYRPSAHLARPQQSLPAWCRRLCTRWAVGLRRDADPMSAAPTCPGRRGARQI